MIVNIIGNFFLAISRLFYGNAGYLGHFKPGK